MTTTRKMLDGIAAGMDCGADGSSVQIGVDACKESGPDAYEEDEEESTGLGDYCECGRATAGDQCQQCGQPLCPMCSETGAGFCKDHPDEHYEDSQQGDAYEDLRQATPEELLEAVSWFWRQSTSVSLAEAEEMTVLLRQGFQLAQPGGWAHVAPMWLRESRKLAALDE